MIVKVCEEMKTKTLCTHSSL